MFSTIINNIIRKATPDNLQPLSIEDVYPCLIGQRERNIERMNAIKAEMGTKWILHPSHAKRKLKTKRPV